MKVAVLTHVGFPEGLAPTNRVFYHTKGLIDNGVEAKVIVVKPTETKDNSKNTEAEGEYKGVPFMYSLGKAARSSYYLQRRIDDIYGPVKSALYVKKNKYDAAMLISSNSFYQPMLFKIMFRIFRIKFIAERTELMFHNKKNYGIFKLKNKIYEQIIYKNIDAFLAISYSLQEKYRELVSPRSPVILIPVIVDDKDIFRTEVPRTRNLVYTGPLVQKKDGILIIIEAFTKIAEKFPDTNLILTGNLDKTPDKDNILKLLENNPYRQRMIFKGFVTRTEMIELLNSAAGLLLAKPLSDQADNCFPTKLGEYLSTKNPIVVTKTGEIPLYLEDGVSAYIAEPSSVDSFADKLNELLSDPKKAAKIGEKGRNVAVENFNYIEISKRVIETFNNIK